MIGRVKPFEEVSHTEARFQAELMGLGCGDRARFRLSAPPYTALIGLLVPPPKANLS